MPQQKKSYLLAAVAILLWATAATAFKLTLAHISAIQMLFSSSLVAAVASLIILLVNGKISELKHLSSRDIIHSILLGLLNPFLYYLVLFRAYELLPAQIAQPLNFIWPITIVILSIPILKQKFRWRHFAALFISFAGVLVISTSGNLQLGGLSKFGMGLALFSAIIWALFFVLNVKDERDEFIKLFLSFSFGTIFSGIVFLFSKQAYVFVPAALWGCVYIGLAEMAITFAIWIKALKLSRTTAQVNSFIYFTPFLSLLFISLILKEQILITTVIGLVIIVLGIFIQER